MVSVGEVLSVGVTVSVGAVVSVGEVLSVGAAVSVGAESPGTVAAVMVVSFVVEQAVLSISTARADAMRAFLCLGIVMAYNRCSECVIGRGIGHGLGVAVGVAEISLTAPAPAALTALSWTR